MFAIRVAVLAAAVFAAGAAGAVTIDYASLSDQSSSSIVQIAGGVTVTAHAFGGVTNPQASMTPTGTPGGFTSLGVNIGGVNLFGTRGLGCGTSLASQCDLIAPIGEDALRLTFSQPVVLDSISFAAWEGPDEATWWAWNGSSYVLAGAQGPDSAPLNGFETFTGPYGPASTSWIIVAENSGATAIALRGIAFTAIPEPGTALLVAIGVAATAARRRARA